MKSQHRVAVLVLLIPDVLSFLLNTNNDLGLESQDTADGQTVQHYISDHPGVINCPEYDHTYQLRPGLQGNVTEHIITFCH